MPQGGRARRGRAFKEQGTTGGEGALFEFSMEGGKESKPPMGAGGAPNGPGELEPTAQLATWTLERCAQSMRLNTNARRYADPLRFLRPTVRARAWAPGLPTRTPLFLAPHVPQEIWPPI